MFEGITEEKILSVVTAMPSTVSDLSRILRVEQEDISVIVLSMLGTNKLKILPAFKLGPKATTDHASSLKKEIDIIRFQLSCKQQELLMLTKKPTLQSLVIQILKDERREMSAQEIYSLGQTKYITLSSPGSFRKAIHSAVKSKKIIATGKKGKQFYCLRRGTNAS